MDDFEDREMAVVEELSTLLSTSSTLQPSNRKAVVQNDIEVITDMKEYKRRAVVAANTYLMGEGAECKDGLRSCQWAEKRQR